MRIGDNIMSADITSFAMRQGAEQPLRATLPTVRQCDAVGLGPVRQGKHRQTAERISGDWPPSLLSSTETNHFTERRKARPGQGSAEENTGDIERHPPIGGRKAYS